MDGVRCDNRFGEMKAVRNGEVEIVFVDERSYISMLAEFGSTR